MQATQAALKATQNELYDAKQAMAESANQLPVCGPQPGLHHISDISLLEEAKQISQDEIEWPKRWLKMC